MTDRLNCKNTSFPTDKMVISAIRQNGDKVFFRSTNNGVEMTEFQEIAFDFNQLEHPFESAEANIENLKGKFKGLSKFEIESI